MALIFPYIWASGKPSIIEIVSWADGTEDQIQAMIDAAFA